MPMMMSARSAADRGEPATLAPSLPKGAARSGVRLYTDSEWPALEAALGQWLAPGNFAPDGTQRNALESFRRVIGPRSLGGRP